MATTGPAVVTSTTAVTSTTTVTGQGNLPIYRCRVSTDDVSVASPIWTELTPNDFRNFTSSRGRGSELEEFASGSGSASFDNRDRAFDPISNPLIDPLNRIWIFEEFSGEVHDIFKGYVDSWDLEYPGGGWSDATSGPSFTDEFTVLSSAALRTTDPPRDTYADLVLSDNPQGVWSFNESAAEIGFFEPTELSAPDAIEPQESRGLIEFKGKDLRRAVPGRTGRKRP